MSAATIDAPASEPLRGLLDDFIDNEQSRSDELARLLEPVEQALSQLADWADRLDAAERAAGEANQQAAAQERAADDRRRKLEHDLRLARARVLELERSLQERTEELLRAQAANNDLAAQLREIGDDEPLETAIPDPEADDRRPYDEADAADGDLMLLGADDGGEPGEGVAERFARLRRS